MNTNRDLSICPSCENTSMTMTERERVKRMKCEDLLMKRSPLLCVCCFGAVVFGPSEDERGGKDFDFA